MIGVLVIAAILFAVAAPRFVNTGSDEARLYNDAVAGLRYAQSTAIARQRVVCATFSSTGITFTYASTYSLNAPPTGTLAACDTNLPAPTGGAAFTVQAQGSATFTTLPIANASLRYDWIGRPYDNSGALLTAQRTITLSSGPSILIEAESGYVH